ncbi:uncharacterized protein LOC116157269 isoform X1 [Camelus dromedarius]|uniref:uncharacterized protein LOC116157269 isoform X1 n=2 Tax=Camelus dromedarius TaxID=9838 RepID=UPI003119AFA9
MTCWLSTGAPAGSSRNSRSAPNPRQPSPRCPGLGEQMPTSSWKLPKLPEPRWTSIPERLMQPWFFQDLLQGFSMTEQPGLGSGGDPVTGAGAAARTDDGQSQDSWGSHTAASPREPWQCPPGCTLSVPPAGFQPELDRVLYALASALSQASGPPARISRKASGQVGEQPLSARQRDPQLVDEVLLKPRPLPSDEKHQGPSPQQQPGPGRPPQGDAKGTDAESRGRGRRTGAFPGLQRKIRQVEDNLDGLNEEFFQLTAQALVLQKEEDRPGQLSPSEGNMFVVLPRTGPPVWQKHRPDPAEAGGPGRENLGTWALNSDQALTLEARRACLAQRAEDLEWELSLLLQVAGGSRPHLGRRESHRGHGAFSTQTRLLCSLLAGRGGLWGTAWPRVCAGLHGMLPGNTQISFKAWTSACADFCLGSFGVRLENQCAFPSLTLSIEPLCFTWSPGFRGERCLGWGL